MAMAVEDALGDRLTDGIAVVKILEPEDRFVRTRVRIGGHPIPNQDGYEACLEILDLIDHAAEEDLFLVRDERRLFRFDELSGGWHLFRG